MKKIIFLSLIILGIFSNACQKAQTNDINEEELVTQVKLSSEFKAAIENLTEIKKLIKNGSPINYSPIDEKL